MYVHGDSHTLSDFLPPTLVPLVVVAAAGQMHDLIAEYSLEVVQAYMGYIMQAAEAAVRNMLVRFSLQRGMDEVGRAAASCLLSPCRASPSCCRVLDGRVSAARWARSTLRTSWTMARPSA